MSSVDGWECQRDISIFLYWIVIDCWGEQDDKFIHFKMKNTENQ